MVKLSLKVKSIKENASLELNQKISDAIQHGEKIYDLTASEFPFKPLPAFVDQIRGELNFLKSFQYASPLGLPELREKLANYFLRSRGLDLGGNKQAYDCLVSNGSQQSLHNVFGGLIEEGDEVIIFAPYSSSYPDMIKLYGGVCKFVRSNIYDNFEPSLDDVEELISEKTKAIVINSPNNPVGATYSSFWMKGFGELMKNHDHVFLLSDEIYFNVYYYDPKPAYFYQYYPELLERTFIVDGISKSLAVSGLRLGYCFGPREGLQGFSKLQMVTTSCASSLIQRSLLNFDFSLFDSFLKPIKAHLRTNAEILRHYFREGNLSHAWYQSNSALYFLIDFSQMPIINVFKQEQDDKRDYSEKICELILEKFNVAISPGVDYGAPNTGRISLVLEKEPFEEAISKLIQFLISD